MSESYAAAGVDTGQADAAVDALVGVLRTIELDRPSASVLPSGHYASVLRVAPNLGIAVSTDGVGSKIVVAEQADRLETVGIDCVAMNVNDLVCVGAEPIAMLDYLAVEQADPQALARIALGLKVGAQAAGVEIPGGELAVLPELIRGHPSPHGFDLCGTALGTVALDAIVTGAEAQPGDAIVGLPSSGLHSNGYTLARRAAAGGGRARRSTTARRCWRAARWPTRCSSRPSSTCAPCSTCCARTSPVNGLAHITGGGLRNLLRLGGERLGFAIEEPLPVPAHLHAGGPARRRPDGRDVGRLQHGLRLRRARARGAGGRRRRAARRPPPGRRAHRHGDRRRRPAVGAGAVGPAVSPRRACGAARRELPHRGKEAAAAGRGRRPWRVALADWTLSG